MNCEALLSFLPLINTILIAVGAGIGLWQYNRQQKFKRIQNLTSIWNKFSADSELLGLFELCDKIETPESATEQQNQGLANYSAPSKFKFLALLEEVAIYTEEFEVDKKYAVYLFQWHFRFVYQSPKTKDLFWQNIGGSSESAKEYWAKSAGFARTLPA